MSDCDHILIKAANGNEAALDFMRRFMHLAHNIDNVIDDEITEPEGVLRVFMQMAVFFAANPFFIENRTVLFPVIITSMDHYANSVMWEHSVDPEKRALADVLRSVGTSVVNFTALLCNKGNVDAMRDISPQNQLNSWAEHHDESGNPI